MKILSDNDRLEEALNAVREAGVPDAVVLQAISTWALQAWETTGLEQGLNSRRALRWCKWLFISKLRKHRSAYNSRMLSNVTNLFGQLYPLVERTFDGELYVSPLIREVSLQETLFAKNDVKCMRRFLDVQPPPRGDDEGPVMQRHLWGPCRSSGVADFSHFWALGDILD